MPDDGGLAEPADNPNSTTESGHKELQQGHSLLKPIQKLFALCGGNPLRKKLEVNANTKERFALSNLRVVSFCVIASRILGLARDSAMAALFGAGPVLDAFVVAFRLPNLARQLLGEGALSTAFLPIFVRELDRHGPHSARQTLTAVALCVGSILVGLVGVCELLVLAVLHYRRPGPSLRLLLELLSLMLPYTILICLAALLCASLHAVRQFLWAGIVPIILNSVWLIGIYFVWNIEGDDALRAKWVAVSIIIAGGLQMALPLFTLSQLGLGLTRDWRPAWGRVREVMGAVLPVVAGLSITQVSSVADSLLAWGLAPGPDGAQAPLAAFGIPPALETGTASALYMGQRMYQFPLGVFGVALGTVIYPVLSRHAERGEMHLLRDDLARGMRLVIAITIPASVGLFLLGPSITAVLFRHGAFNNEDAELTATMISAYGTGVWAFIALMILNRGFYAVGDRLTPMRLGMVSLAVNFIINFSLVWFIGGLGLVLGSLGGAIVQLILTLRRVNSKIGPLDAPPILRTLWKTLLATAVMAAGCLLLVILVPAEGAPLRRAAALLVQILSGMFLFVATAWVLQIREIQDLLSVAWGGTGSDSADAAS